MIWRRLHKYLCIYKSGSTMLSRYAELETRKLTHEANNVLLTVRLFAAAIESGNADREKVKSMATYIAGATEQLSALFEQVRDLTALQVPRPSFILGGGNILEQKPRTGHKVPAT